MTENGEKAVPREKSFPDRIETFIRTNENFKKLFNAALTEHIGKLENSIKKEEEEKPDVENSISKFKEIQDLVLSGFDGYDQRSYKGVFKKGSFVMFFARPEDLSFEDPEKLDLSKGQTKKEYEVIISKTGWAGFGNSAEKVMDSSKIQMEISERSLTYHERLGEVRAKKHHGVSVHLSVTGGCTAMGVKHDGFTPYDSREKYSLDCEYSSQLINQIDSLGIY